jgi:hypothetical protein
MVVVRCSGWSQSAPLAGPNTKYKRALKKPKEICMKLIGSSKILKVGVLTLLVALSLPIDTFAQGRGRGEGNRREGNWNSKKCGKFVNCHDARDGRWDGRGPNRTLSWRDRMRLRNRRDRRRFNDDDRRRWSRRHRSDRDWDSSRNRRRY